MDFAEDKLRNCVASNHDITAVFYISSLMIAPRVAFHGMRLLDKIDRIASLSPDCIFVVRTTAPSYFPSSMRKLQKKSIDFLRSRCYVTVYSPKREFLNHAKFYLHFHTCFSEKIVHYAYFYGSTNLTAKGLANPGGRGNYEEYNASRNVKYGFSSRDKEYLGEIFDIMTHRTSLYTSAKYLAQHVSGHLALLQSLQRGEKPQDSMPTNVAAFQSYLDSLALYNQTFALLEEIPGKQLTEAIVDSLSLIKPPANPFEIEMLSLLEDDAELPLDALGYDDILKEWPAKEIEGATREASRLVAKEYEPAIERIESYMDEKEKTFLGLLRENKERRTGHMNRILESKRL